jgi:hypothetical protein
MNKATVEFENYKGFHIYRVKLNDKVLNFFDGTTGKQLAEGLRDRINGALASKPKEFKLSPKAKTFGVNKWYKCRGNEDSVRYGRADNGKWYIDNRRECYESTNYDNHMDAFTLDKELSTPDNPFAHLGIKEVYKLQSSPKTDNLRWCLLHNGDRLWIKINDPKWSEESGFTVKQITANCNYVLDTELTAKFANPNLENKNAAVDPLDTAINLIQELLDDTYIHGSAWHKAYNFLKEQKK